MKATGVVPFVVSLLALCLLQPRCQVIAAFASRSQDPLLQQPSPSKIPPPASDASFPAASGTSDRSRALKHVFDAFKVLDNTIIRTKESRASGARFLNESSLGSRESCLKWCQEYQTVVQEASSVSCSVAVFEESGKKSCYLFDCGIPGPEFRCQFTFHASYTSSILNHASLDLKEWREQSDHESDLVRLKSERSLHSVVTPSINSIPIQLDKKNTEDAVSELQPPKTSEYLASHPLLPSSAPATLDSRTVVTDESDPFARRKQMPAFPGCLQQHE